MAAILKQSTQAIVHVGPFVDSATATVFNSAVVLSAGDHTTAIKHNTSAAPANISGRTWSRVVGADGYYSLTLTTGDTDTVGPLTVQINDVSAYLPVFKEFHVVEEAIYDAIWGAGAAGFDASGQVTVGSLSANVITAAAISANAIASAKISANAVTKIQASLATLTSLAARTITSATYATSTQALSAATLAASAITSATFSANAITSASISANAVTKIQASQVTSAQVFAQTLASSAYATSTAVAALPVASAIADAMFTVQGGTYSGTAVASSVVKQIADNASATLGPSSITSNTFSAGAITSFATSADFVTKVQASQVTSAQVFAQTLASSAYATSTQALAPATLAASAIVSATISANALVQAHFSANAIASAAISADAVSKIQASQVTSAQVFAQTQPTSAYTTSTQVAGITGATPAQVSTAALSAITAYDPPTSAEVAARTQLASAYVTSTQVFAQTLLSSAYAISTAVASLPVASAIAEAMFTLQAGTYSGTAVASSVVKQIADNAGGAALTVSAIVDGMFTVDAGTYSGTATASSVVKQTADNASATLGPSSITSATFSASAITAFAFSADAVTKIQASQVTSAQVFAQTQPTSAYTTSTQVAAIPTTAMRGTDSAALASDLTTLQASVDGIGTAGGAAISVDANTSNEGGGITGVTSATIGIGTFTNTYTATSVLDGTTHQVDRDAGASIDVVYQFLTGGGTSPVGVKWTGFATNNDVITFSAWNFGVGWETIGTYTGTATSTNVAVNLLLFARHSGTVAAELGKVYIRLNSSSTGVIVDTDQLVVDYAVTSRTVGYANGAVWIDTVTGVAGTESFVNGVADNPVLSLADALTIATNNLLRKFWVGNGSTITLAATTANKVFEGHEWTLALGGQNIADSMFIDADVSGTSTGADAEFEDCIFGTASMVAHQAYNCSYTGTMTLSATGDYRFINCQSGIAGASAPTFALGTGDMTMEFRRWSGGINFTGIGLNDVITISGEMGTIDLGSATAGTVEVRGTYKAITNGASGVTVNLAGAILGGDVASILASQVTSAQVFAQTIASSAYATSTQVAAIPSSGIAASAVSTAALSAITAYSASTSAEVAARTILASAYATSAAVAALNDVSTAEVSTAALSAVVAHGTSTSAEVAARTILASAYATSSAIAATATSAQAASISAIVTSLNAAIIYGAVTSAAVATTSACTTNLTGYTDDQLIGRVILFTSGVADGEAAPISDYISADATVIFSANVLTLAPGAADTIKIV